MRRSLFAVAGVLAWGASMPVQSADLVEVVEVTEVYAQRSLCAVSGPNGKIEAAGGGIGQDAFDSSRFHAAGSVSLPLGCRFGFQLDGLVGETASNTVWGVGGHLFMRDPTTYLAGVYAEYSDAGPNSVSRFAVEGQYYFDRFTLTGLAGYEHSTQLDGEFFGAAQVGYYPTDDINLNFGVARYLDINALTLGAEWQPQPSASVTLFAYGAIAENNASSVYGGLRWYFGGEPKSLIRRHREDDPNTWTDRMQRTVSSMAPTPKTTTPAKTDECDYVPDVESKISAIDICEDE